MIVALSPMAWKILLVLAVERFARDIFSFASVWLDLISSVRAVVAASFSLLSSWRVCMAGCVCSAWRMWQRLIGDML